MFYSRLRVCAAAVLLLLPFVGNALSWQDTTRHISGDVNGVVTSRFEYATLDNESRFQVRYARLSGGFNVSAFRGFVQVDFCDRGKVKILDAWARYNVAKGVSVQMGQFRVPFGEDCFVGPANYYFANRSFVAKYMLGLRAVGAQAQWQLFDTGLSVTGGVFSNEAMTDHTKWTKTVGQALRVQYKSGGWRLTGSVINHKPDSVRRVAADIAGGYVSPRLTVMAEYMYKHFAHDRYDATHGWLVYGNYGDKMKLGVFNRWSVQTRLEGMTKHPGNSPQKRLTLGGTLAHVAACGAEAQVRLNYEKFLYSKGHAPTTNDRNDRIVAELVVSF